MSRESCITSVHTSMGHSSQELGTWSTLLSLKLSRLQSPFSKGSNLSRELGWPCFFQVWAESSLQFSPESLCSSVLLVLEGLSAFISYAGWQGPSESDKFQELPGIILSCLPSCLRSFPKEWNVSILKETVTQQQLIVSWTILPKICFTTCVDSIGKIKV